MDFAAIARFGLLIVRPGAMLLVGPGLAGPHVPLMARIGLTVFLAIAMAPAVPMPVGPDAGIVVVVFREIAIGITLGFVARAFIAGAEFAGHLASQQIGFSYAATIDPVGGARNTTLAALYGGLATFTWLGIDGHHLLIRAVHATYQELPIGTGQVHGSLVEAVRAVLGLVFVTGLRLAAPVVAVILLVEVAVGLISRAAPALSFQIIGYPVRLAIGLIVVVATVATVPGVTRALAESVVALAMRMAAAFR